MAALLTITGILCSVTGFAGQSAGDSESHFFVDQLIAVRDFETAESFCEQKIESAASPQERLEWELKLSDCCRTHSWLLSGVDREGFLLQAHERLSELIAGASEFPDYQLMLEVRQMQLVITLCRTHLLVLQSGQLPGKSLAGNTSVDGHGTMNLTRSSAEGSGSRSNRAPVRSREEYLNLLGRVSTQADEMVSRISSVRRDLDAQTVRTISELTRLHAAEAAALMVALKPLGNERESLLSRTEEQLKKLSGTLSDPELRFQTRRLSAELQLLKTDSQSFEQQLKGARSAAPGNRQIADCELLAIRGLLKSGRMTEAKKQLRDAVTPPAKRTSDDHNAMLSADDAEVICLELECLLGIICLQDELNDVAGMKQTADDFGVTERRSGALLTGVWRESADRIISRFQRVQRHGVYAERLLQEAQLLEASGQTDAALALLLNGIRSSPETMPAQRRVPLLMKSGQTAVAARDWKTAVEQLAAAESLFDQLTDRRSAAAADLLRVYALGKLWESDPVSSRKAAYESALDRHVQRYHDQPTSKQITDWKLRLSQSLKHSDVIAESLAAWDQSQSDDRIRHLCLAAETLVAHLEKTLEQPHKNNRAARSPESPVAASPNPAADSAGDSPSLTVEQLLGLTQQFLSRYEMLSSDALQTKHSEAVTQLRYDAIELRLTTAGISGNEADWKQLSSEVASIRSVSGKPTNLRQFYLSAIVQLRSGTQMETLQKEFKEHETGSELATIRTAQFFDHCLRMLTVRPEDVILATWLAKSMEPLIAQKGTVSEKTELLRICRTVGQRTGNRNLTETLLLQLMKETISESELTEIAAVLAEKTSIARTSTAKPSSAELQFWRSTVKRSPQGSELWLESSLQSARLALAGGDRDRCVRILEVVEALYPDWGGSERAQGAADLRRTATKVSP